MYLENHNIILGCYAHERNLECANTPPYNFFIHLPCKVLFGPTVCVHLPCKIQLCSRTEMLLHCTRIISFIETRSTYHLNGIFGNSRENSNGTAHPGGFFFRKRVIPFEVFPFSRFDWNAQKFLYHLSTITSARENRLFHLFFNRNNPFFWQMIQHIPILFF